MACFLMRLCREAAARVAGPTALLLGRHEARAVCRPALVVGHASSSGSACPVEAAPSSAQGLGRVPPSWANERSPVFPRIRRRRRCHRCRPGHPARRPGLLSYWDTTGPWPSAARPPADGLQAVLPGPPDPTRRTRASRRPPGARDHAVVIGRK